MDSRDEHKKTDALARRITQRWRPTSAAIGIVPTVQRIQRTVSRVGVIQPRVDRLPVVSMDRYASRHLARFPEATTHFEPRTMTLPEAPGLPLVGETTIEPAREAPPEPPGGPFTDSAVAPADDEEPEWLKRLPSFEEATAQLRFPDSVDVKLPEPTRPTARTQAPTPSANRADEAEASTSSASQAPELRAAQPPDIARTPEAPEPPKGPRRMRVMTQVEEFTPGKEPPPVSLQDLRRVRVGEPQPARPKAEVQRASSDAVEPAPAEPAEPLEAPAAVDEAAPSVIEAQPSALQRAATEPVGPEPAPPKPAVTHEPPVRAAEERPDVESQFPEAEMAPASAEGETSTEVVPEPPAPTAARETQVSETASTPPTNAPARRPPASRADELPAIQRAPTDAAEPTPPVPPDAQEIPTREEPDAAPGDAPLRRDAVPASEGPQLVQPPTETPPTAAVEKQIVPESPKLTVARETAIGDTTKAEEDEDAPPVEPVSSEPAAASEIQALQREASKLAPSSTDAQFIGDSEPPMLRRTPAEPSAPDSLEAEIAPRPAAAERTSEGPRRGAVETSTTAEEVQTAAEGGEPPALQRTPADVAEPEPSEPTSPLPGPALEGEKVLPSGEAEPPVVQRAPTEPATEPRDEEPKPTNEGEAPSPDVSEPPVIQRAPTEATAPELPVSQPLRQAPVPEGDDTPPGEEMPLAAESEPPAVQPGPVEEPPTETRDVKSSPTSEEKAALAEMRASPTVQRTPTDATEHEPPADTAAPQARAAADDERPTAEGESLLMQRKPKEAAGPESGAQPTVKRVQNESTPHEEEAMASVDTESEPSTIQRAPAQVTAPEAPKRPAPRSSLAAPVLEDDEVPQPTVGQGQEREPEAQSHGSVPTGLPDLAVDAGLVQRLSARTEVAIQRKPASTRAEETVVQPPSPPEPATEAPGPDASGPSPARTPPAAPLSVASRTLPRQTDALARTREARPRAPVRVDLPVAPRPAVVQRTALRPETETGTSPEPIGAPTMTLDAQPPSIMPTRPTSTVIQRAPSAEPVTESRTLEETPEPLPEELISLLEDSDLMQLAREVLPIVKRLLRTELERRSQPDLEW